MTITFGNHEYQRCPQAQATSAAPVALPNSGPAATLTCVNCGHAVNLPPPEERWYAVLVGLHVGWVKGWEYMNWLTDRVSGARKQWCADENSA
ncbi:hypothetical protein VKT23_009956 [Stygiomarasmius scandens]|uniref:Uncharacterized protein n=1 Tax=Marasmiellus scandens TaxID=2682957 RepID=A0ABR1JCL3_9AGAR